MTRRLIVASLAAVAVAATVWLLQTYLADRGDGSAVPAGAAAPSPPAGSSLDSDALVALGRDLFKRDAATRRAAIDAIRARGDADMAPALILSMRYMGDATGAATATLRELTGADIGASWPDWMVWQETHPEIAAFDGFDRLKTAVLATIDGNYLDFIHAGVAHEIRLEEIVWGGVRARNGIPSLDFAAQIPAAEADYLNDDDLVFGISINGDTRAYPLRIMNWHEMFNDRIGGVDLALAYCTLCGSGILYETLIDGADEPFLFGSSGLLYRSNKLMFDRGTNSLWNQFTGRPVVGPLVGSGIELKTRPVVITSWHKWRTRHPDTTVLSLDTGHTRDYRPGAVYGDYFASPDLMFPAATPDGELEPKDYVFGITVPGKLKAWPLSVFDDQPVLVDDLDGTPIVLIGERATRSVRAYEAGAFTADTGDVTAAALDGEALVLGGERWQVTETALVAADGRILPRLAGHVAYWFAWAGFRGETELYRAP